MGGGGFIDICMRSQALILCGQFDAGGTEYVFGDGRLAISQPGRHRKLVESVEQVTFSGHHAVTDGRRVMLITERAVFDLTPKGWRLIEIAPGVRLQEDILDRMGFAPTVEDPKPMAAALFDADDGSAA